MNLKEQALATLQANRCSAERSQEAASKRRAEKYAKYLNELLGSETFFVPEESIIPVTSRVRNTRDFKIRATTTNYEVITDGSIDIGVAVAERVKLDLPMDTTAFLVLQPCSRNCGEYVSEHLGTFQPDRSSEEQLKLLISKMSVSLGRLEGAICSSCKFQACPTCGHAQ